MKRSCYLCGSDIHECMGSVHAGSFYDFMGGFGSGKVYELCPKCATKYANADPPCYPQPSGYKYLTLKG